MWGAGHGDPVGRGGYRSVQGLIHRVIGSSNGPGGSPCRLRAERVEDIFFPEDIREISDMVPLPE